MHMHFGGCNRGLGAFTGKPINITSSGAYHTKNAWNVLKLTNKTTNNFSKTKDENLTFGDKFNTSLWFNMFCYSKFLLLIKLSNVCVSKKTCKISSFLAVFRRNPEHVQKRSRNRIHNWKRVVFIYTWKGINVQFQPTKSPKTFEVIFTWNNLHFRKCSRLTDVTVAIFSRAF